MTSFQQIPLGQLHVSHTDAQSERRRHLEKGAIAELAASIRELGVLQPIIVTSVGNGAAKKLAPHGVHNAPDGYVKLDEHCWDDAKNRTYAQLLGKAAPASVLLQDPKTGKVVEIVKEKDVQAALKAKGVKLRDSGSDRYRNEQRNLQKKRDAALAYRATLFLAVREAAVKRGEVLSRPGLERVAERLFKDLSSDCQKKLAKVLEWPIAKSKLHNGVDIKLPKLAELEDLDLEHLIRDLVLAHELVTWTYSTDKPEQLEAAAAELGVDAKKIKAEIVAAEKTKAKVKRRAGRRASK